MEWMGTTYFIPPPPPPLPPHPPLLHLLPLPLLLLLLPLPSLLIGSGCPRQYYSDMNAIFPGQDPSSLLIVPTCQNSDVDLVRVGDEIEEEKDRLLEVVSECVGKGVERG